MSRFFAAMMAVSAFAVGATAHAPYLVPVPPTPNGAVPHWTLKVVFSDSLEADPKIKAETWKRLDGLMLGATESNGTVTPLVLTPGENCRVSPLPADARTVTGRVVYGVYQKGDAPAMLVTYYPKATLGELSAEPKLVAEGLDIAPVPADGKLRFRVTNGGKPVAGLAVTVITAKGAPQKLTTDEKGLTPGVPTGVRYGVMARVETETAGEHGGKKYAKRADVATLVVGAK